MRLGELLESKVVTVNGKELGEAHDILMVQNGPQQGAFGAALRVLGLQVGTWSIGSRLGYGGGKMKGPWAIRAYFDWRHRDALYVPWSEVRAIEPDRIVVASSEPGHGPDSGPGRLVNAGLELLDAQMIDVDGLMAGKVDDVQLETPEDGGPPFATAILSGPAALGRRMGGRSGRWLESVHRRLHPDADPGPAEVGFGVVKKLGNHLDLIVSKHDLPVAEVERWIRDRFISRIPGA
jgi:sporulation protein YlmC with PRC-barrel domain